MNKDEILAVGFTVECMTTALSFPPSYVPETCSLLTIVSYRRNM